MIRRLFTVAELDSVGSGISEEVLVGPSLSVGVVVCVHPVLHEGRPRRPVERYHTASGHRPAEEVPWFTMQSIRQVKLSRKEIR